MQICAKRKQASEGIIFPSNSGSKPHKAYAWKEDAPEVHGAFCSCQAYIFGRSKIAKAEGVDPRTVAFVCKHLKVVFDSYCGWKQTGEHDYQYDRTCPQCGGDVIDTDDALIPEDTAGAVDDLRAMLAEMDGEEPPPPIAQPKDYEVVVDVTEVRRFVVNATDEDQAKVLALKMWAEQPVSEQSQPEVVNVEEVGAKPKATKSKSKSKPTTVGNDANAAAASLAASVAPKRRSA